MSTSSSNPRPDPGLDVDLLVLGGTPAGVAAASTAAGYGLRAAIVCPNAPDGGPQWAGGLPARALVAAAARGLSFADGRRFAEQVRARSASAQRAALAAADVQLVIGRPLVVGIEGSRVQVDVDRSASEDWHDRPGRPQQRPQPGTTRRVRARRVIVAAGARFDTPSVTGLPDVAYLTPSTVLEVADLPDSLVILGGGRTGCEFAQAFARFGSRVTLVEREPRLLAHAPARACALAQEALEADGVRVLLGGTVQRVAPTLDGGAYVGTEVGGNVAATRLLVATGSRPDARGLGLDSAGLHVGTDGALGVDPWLRTRVPAVLAAGDPAAGAPRHAGEVMGRIAARNAFAPRGASAWLQRVRGATPASPSAARWNATAMPDVTLTDPEIALVGMSADDAASAGYRDVRASDVAQDCLDAALAQGRRDVFLSVVTAVAPGLRRWRGRIVVGACAVGPRAGDVIAELALAVQACVPVEVLTAGGFAAGPGYCAGVGQALERSSLTALTESGRPR